MSFVLRWHFSKSLFCRLCNWPLKMGSVQVELKLCLQCCLQSCLFKMFVLKLNAWSPLSDVAWLTPGAWCNYKREFRGSILFMQDTDLPWRDAHSQFNPLPSPHLWMTSSLLFLASNENVYFIEKGLLVYQVNDSMNWTTTSCSPLTLHVKPLRWCNVPGASCSPPGLHYLGKPVSVTGSLLVEDFKV